MIDELLASATRQRNDALALRREAREAPEKRQELLEAAAETFGKAIASLERLLRTVRRNPGAGGQDECRILEVLSQSLGSLGGTYRDMRDHKQAILTYDRGNEYEEERRQKCKAKDTYNLLQRLIVRLLDNPALVREVAFLDQLRAVRDVIQRQVDEGRDDSWALADLVLVRFLCGADADQQIADLERRKAEATFYESTYNAIVTLLDEGLGKGDSLGTQLESFRRLLQRQGGLT